MSALSLAEAEIASLSLKPTPMTRLQFSPTIPSTLRLKSESVLDSAVFDLTPRSLTALSRPSLADWLKDLSSHPPESETRHAV